MCNLIGAHQKQEQELFTEGRRTSQCKLIVAVTSGDSLEVDSSNAVQPGSKF